MINFKTNIKGKIFFKDNNWKKKILKILINLKEPKTYLINMEWSNNYTKYLNGNEI
jgi:hypothetical protein